MMLHTVSLSKHDSSTTNLVKENHIIFIIKQQGHSQRSISKAIGGSPSTASRELHTSLLVRQQLLRHSYSLIRQSVCSSQAPLPVDQRRVSDYTRKWQSDELRILFCEATTRISTFSSGNVFPRKWNFGQSGKNKSARWQKP